MADIEENKIITNGIDYKQAPPKINTYAAKKSVAQRMMDIALLTSNANQLRYILRYNSGTSSFGLALGLIVVSLALQVTVGLYLIFATKKDSTREEKDRSNNIVVCGVFLITFVNVLASVFGEDGAPPATTTFGDVTTRDSIIDENGGSPTNSSGNK